MDLYEALKSGKTAEELIQIFRQELTAAQKKLKQQQKQQNLDKARDQLIFYIFKYLEILLDKTFYDNELVTLSEGLSKYLKTIETIQPKLDDLLWTAVAAVDTLQQTFDKIT